MTEIPDLPVTVEWELDRYDVMNVTGEIQAGALQEALAEEADGVLVGLRAFLTYTEDPKKQAVHAVSVRILEPERTAGEELLERIREEIRTYDGGNRTKEAVRLPEEVGGKEIRYHLPMDPRAGWSLSWGS